MSLLESMISGFSTRDTSIASIGGQSSDLSLFLDILQEIRPGVNKDYFYDMITDPTRACITGSSVLGKRVNKLEIANDIDIFIDNRYQDNTKVVKSFFTNETISNNIWPAYDKKVLTKEDKSNFISGARMLETSNSAYEFKIDAYSLKTFRINLGEFIHLNFIFLNDQKQIVTKDNTESDSPKFLMTKTTAYPFPNNFLNRLLDANVIQETEEAMKYSSFILEYIEQHFDFQELKYIYDFETKTYKSIYEIMARLNQRMLDMLTTIESSSSTDIIINQLNGAGTLMVKIQDEFKEFNNPDIVTIASHEHREQRFGSVSQVYELDALQAMSGDNLERAATDFSALYKRIKQYQGKGFKIEDPENILVNLHTTLASAVLGILVDPDINSIERQAIFGSRPQVKKNYLFLNRLRVSVEENKEELGLDLVRHGNKTTKDEKETVDTW